MLDIFQKTISLQSYPRGCHLVTSEILKQLPELKDFDVGLLNIFIQHTSASITINENCCSEVQTDLNKWLDKTVPENFNWDHTQEGKDDMPAHAKSSLMGVSLDIPIKNGGLNLGTWQGIYLNEHRNRGGSRKLVLTITGKRKSK